MYSIKAEEREQKSPRSTEEKKSANKSKGSNSDQENRTGRGNKKDSHGERRNG